MLAGHRQFFCISAVWRCELLQAPGAPCYGSRLKCFESRSALLLLSIRKRWSRLRIFSGHSLLALLSIPLDLGILDAQSVSQRIKANLPAEDEIRFESINEDSNGSMRLLHKNARIETSDMVISADEI